MCLLEELSCCLQNKDKSPLHTLASSGSSADSASSSVFAEEVAGSDAAADSETAAAALAACLDWLLAFAAAPPDAAAFFSAAAAVAAAFRPAALFTAFCGVAAGASAEASAACAGDALPLLPPPLLWRFAAGRSDADGSGAGCFRPLAPLAAEAGRAAGCCAACAATLLPRVLLLPGGEAATLSSSSLSLPLSESDSSPSDSSCPSFCLPARARALRPAIHNHASMAVPALTAVTPLLSLL